jgi:hypothetical protein
MEMTLTGKMNAMLTPLILLAYRYALKAGNPYHGKDLMPPKALHQPTNDISWRQAA